MKKILLATALTFALFSTASAQQAPGGSAHRKAMMEEKISKLPPEKAAIVRKSIEESRASNKPKYEQMDKMRVELSAIMEADTFDKAAYLAKAKQMADVRHEMEMKRAESIAATATQLNAEERRIMAPGHGKNRFREGARSAPDAPKGQ